MATLRLARTLLRDHAVKIASAATITSSICLAHSDVALNESAASLKHGVGDARLSMAQTVANVVYGAPFKTIVGVSVPCYVATFAYESLSPATASMLLSQRLIHTRVYGQAIAVATTVGVMAFVQQMEKAGGIYRLEGSRVVRGEVAAPLRHWYSRSAAEMERDERAIADEYDAHGHRVGAADLPLPLAYAPALPLLWIGLRGRIAPNRLTQLMLGVTGAAFAHGVYVMTGDSSMRVHES